MTPESCERSRGRAPTENKKGATPSARSQTRNRLGERALAAPERPPHAPSGVSKITRRAVYSRTIRANTRGKAPSQSAGHAPMGMSPGTCLHPTAAPPRPHGRRSSKGS
jgi:hypothetical protein